MLKKSEMGVEKKEKLTIIICFGIPIIFGLIPVVIAIWNG